MHRLPYLLILILLAGCASGVREAPVVEAPAVPELPLDVHWVRNSAEYRALVLATYVAAGQRLEELAPGREAGTWAVALDADETVISNSQYQKELVAAGERHSRERWYAWARRHEAPALPGARPFLERVRQLGGKIAIVTNRDEAICDDTRANFRKESLPFDVILCRTGEDRKEPRWAMVEAGTTPAGLAALEIVMWLGDNIQDFPGWTQDQRFEEADAFADFGVEYFVLPNPMYGSWVRNPRD